MAFSIVFTATLFASLTWALSAAGLNIHLPLFAVFSYYGHPVPVMLRILLPGMVSGLLFWVMVVLLLRRVVLMIKAKSCEPPHTFGNVTQALACLALLSLFLMIIGLALSIAFKWGSGVPSAMVGIPSALLLAPTVTWVEVRSLLQSGGRLNSLPR